MGYSLLGSSVHGIFQARVLEWGAIAFSRLLGYLGPNYGLPWCLSKASVYNVGDLGSIPAWGRSPGEGNGNPLLYSCLENPMDRGA